MKLSRLFAASLLMCSGTAVMAQESPTTQPQEKRIERRESEVRDSQMEQEIAAIKLSACRSEIELAKFAEERSKNPKVREFAAMMVKDHTEACKELEKWAGDYGNSDKTRGDRDTSNKEAVTEAKPGARLELETKKGGVVGVDFNASQQGTRSGKASWVAIHQQMSEKCLAAAKQELSEKDGAEFDKCFIGMQLAAHQKTIIADEVFANYVSDESQKKLEKCKATATKHLEAAKAIHKELESTSTAGKR